MKLPHTRRVAWFIFLCVGLQAAHAAESASALTLKQAIGAAIAHHPELQSAALRIDVQKSRLAQASLRPSPEISFTVENVLGTGAVRGDKAAEYTLALSQVLELGDKRGARIGAAESALDQSDVDRQILALDVLSAVTRRFIEVAALQERQRLAERARNLAQETVNAAQRRLDAAKSPRAELLRAQISVNRADLELSRIKTELDGAKRQLAANWDESRLRIDGQSYMEVQADLFTLPEAGDVSELMTRLQKSPDFIRFAAEARLRDAELRLATSLRHPDLTVSGGVRRLEQSDDEGLVASVSLPLFLGSRAKAGIAEAEANRALVDSERRSTEAKARALLFSLHGQLRQALLEAQGIQSNILPHAAEALKATETAYERGRYSYLELVDAQREYLAVQSALIDTASNAHLLRNEIERLTHAPLTTNNEITP